MADERSPLAARARAARRHAAALGLSLALLVAAAAANGRAEPVRLPARLPRGAPRLVVTQASGTSVRHARVNARTHAPAVVACVASAQRADLARLEAAQVARAVVHLAPDGRASSIELVPSRLAPGLSACLARALLDWRQPAPARGRRPAVQMLLNLAPQR